MSGMWERLDASGWLLAGEEPQGLQVHPWLRHPDQPRTWLFKARDESGAGPLTEDLAERLACELAFELGVPCARVQLAERGGSAGCLVEDLRPSRWGDQPGQVLLAADTEHGWRNFGHSIPNIHKHLRDFGAPPDFTGPEALSAFDVFAGYLMFDALIANTDRHDRNWAVLQRPPGQAGRDLLCGSFDHASSLGFNLSDEKRKRRLHDGTVRSWTEGGKARQFERAIGAPLLTLVELAQLAFDAASPEARTHWSGRLAALSAEQTREVLARAPGLSDAAVTFTLEALSINRGRLLDVL